MTSCESTGRELSFEWSHHRISSIDSKVRVTLQNPIKHSGSERVNGFIVKRQRQLRRRLRRRHLKVNSRYFKVYRAYSIWFSSSNVGNFFLELNFKRVYRSSGK